MKAKNTNTANWDQARHTLAATQIIGDKVRNFQGEELGKLEDIMLDVHTGKVAYAVLSFGGFLGMGDKLFAIPWSSLTIDFAAKEIRLGVSKERLKQAPGFDKSHWPDFTDATYTGSIDRYYDASLL